MPKFWPRHSPKFPEIINAGLPIESNGHACSPTPFRALSAPNPSPPVFRPKFARVARDQGFSGETAGSADRPETAIAKAVEGFMLSTMVVGIRMVVPRSLVVS
jgi:hypothetical protein